MSLKWPAVHPMRLAAVLLLAGAVTLGSYQVLKPRTFSYLKLRDGVAAEGGQRLQPEMVEEGLLTMGGLLAPAKSPLPGLIAWADAPKYLGVPFARSVRDGAPLFADDLDVQGEGTREQGIAEGKTGMSIPVDGDAGETPPLEAGDRVHVYASFEDEEGGHTGWLLREIPVIAVQRDTIGEMPTIRAVTVALTMREAVLLTHALHYGEVRLGRASVLDRKGAGVGDEQFAALLLRNGKRTNETKEERP